MTTLKTKSSKKETDVSKVKKNLKQMSGKAAKERMRPKLIKAMERLDKLLQSNNEQIAFGAVKLIINKFIPDLRVTELQGNIEKPILIDLNINEQNKIHRAGKVSTETIDSL